MTGPATVPAVLDALAAWASDDTAAWQELLVRGYRQAGSGLVIRMRVYDALDSAATGLGYDDIDDCGQRGGIAAVRAMIARAREAYDGDA